MKKIGVVGSRRRDSAKDWDLVEKAVLDVYERGDWLVSGGCPRGADNFAEKIAYRHGMRIAIYNAWWNGPDGKRAGFVRNGDIAKSSDVLIACVAPDRMGGTEDTVRKFQKAHPEGKLILV